MKPVIIIAIAVVCSVGTILAIQSLNMDDDFSKSISLTDTTYKYNTICDVGDPLEFYKTEILPVEGEILGGVHNENEHLIKFFKENEILGRLNITPDQIYEITPTEHEGLGPNYDPIFYDMMFLIPPALEIMNASPEFVESFTIQDGDSQSSYANRLYSEKSKCS